MQNHTYAFIIGIFITAVFFFWYRDKTRRANKQLRWLMVHNPLYMFMYGIQGSPSAELYVTRSPHLRDVQNFLDCHQPDGTKKSYLIPCRLKPETHFVVVVQPVRLDECEKVHIDLLEVYLSMVGALNGGAERQSVRVDEVLEQIYGFKVKTLYARNADNDCVDVNPKTV